MFKLCRSSLFTDFIVAADFADMGGKLGLRHLLSDKEMKWLQHNKKKYIMHLIHCDGMKCAPGGGIKLIPTNKKM